MNTHPPNLPKPLKAALARLRLQSPPNLPAICKITARMPAVHRPHARCSQAVRVVARRRVLGYRLEQSRRLLDESVIIPVLGARRV